MNKTRLNSCDSFAKKMRRQQQQQSAPNQNQRNLKYFRVVGTIAPIILLGVVVSIPIIWLIANGIQSQNGGTPRTTSLTSAATPTVVTLTTHPVTTETPSNDTTTTATTETTTATTATTSTTTATTTTTTTTSPATTTTTTATTSTSTSTTTTAPPTTLPFDTCNACGQNAAASVCVLENAACQSNAYNCPVLCYGTFLQNGAVPLTCLNGVIPQWPPFRDCLCNSGNCTGNCNANCHYTTGVSTAVPTATPTACMTCTANAISAHCQAQYNSCFANPDSACALLCYPYYVSNLPIYIGCTNTTLVPEWQPLATCLCPYCNSPSVCDANPC